ncbi:MAG: hypothetical protein HQ481_03330 [Alphaproteobacteria bacterium]|nr:hypothetical protein [Alphaproteobacteria bacterium]
METKISVVMERIEPYLDLFDRIVRHGHEVYSSYPPDIAVDLDSSAQAHCTYRHIKAEAHSVLDELPGVRHVDMRGQNLWLIEPANIVCRFKKTDEDGVSTNYPTPQAKAFDRGDDLPGLPLEPTRLTIGYLLDAAGIGFVRSQVSLPAGRQTLWCAAIVPADAREVGETAWYEATKQTRLA